MAVYKVVDTEQLESEMTEIANTIRTKGGTTEKLAWPEGYKAAVAAIPTEKTFEYTNVLKLDTTSYMQNRYWSPGSAAWTAKDACRTVIFEVPSGMLEIRMAGPLGFFAAGPIAGSQILLSNSADSGFVVVDRWYNLWSQDEYGTSVYTVDNSAGYKYCAFPLGAGDYSQAQYAAQIITINEPIG